MLIAVMYNIYTFKLFLECIKLRQPIFLIWEKEHWKIIESIHVHVSETDPITSDLKEGRYF